ncbi:MAG: universal stress protein [Verrucomicrobia bacterium]|nr:MAG: universal stress protein [Verrucomicrobiota bacterium]TAE88336.1 MAG: universal stress protein [Verrucomicrobiota bacterium]TAF26790.1 MAG: universal stress protein [Verrucomicrobiota bacterium]TAF42047.1 MAG: universal stress protein [Verrucomicrobiota bacterium]
MIRNLWTSGFRAYIANAMKTIVAALDFSNATPLVLHAAVEYARAFGASLQLLHVVEPEPSYTAYGFTPDEFPAIHMFQEEARKRAGARLEELRVQVVGQVPNVSAHLVEGSPLHTLVDHLKKQQADLVILGSHGHGAVAALLLGSVAEGMVRKALLPTLVIPAPGKP